MRRAVLTLFAVAALLAAAVPAQAQGRYGSDNHLRFRLGLFTPDAESAYWDDTFDVFNTDADSFEDATLGVDFRYGLGRRSGVLFSADFLAGEDDVAYRDFVDAQGFDIVHTTSLDVVAFTAAYQLNLAGPGSSVIPYAGIGGGLYVWELEEVGDFIDFAPAVPEVFSTTFSDDGETFGWFWMLGLEVPLGPRWSFLAEARWHNADDELSGDFEGLGDLDLSGRSITGGMAWSF